MSQLVEKYLDDTGRQREWPNKTVLRNRGELREFLEIIGDKPNNGYTRTASTSRTFSWRYRSDGKGAVQGPAARRGGAEGIGAQSWRREDRSTQSRSPSTTRSGTVSLFFEWAKSRDSSVVDPLRTHVQRFNKRKGKKRHPWTVAELNRMIADPITRMPVRIHWKQPGNSSCSANRRSTGCRSLPCSRACGWARSSRCRSLT